MSAQPIFQNKQDEWAFYRRRDHSNLEAEQNLTIAEIARRAAAKYRQENPDVENPPTFEMPPNVRHLISALQGVYDSGVKPFEEYARDYLTIGKQLQFTGSESTIRARVRDWVDALDDWQYLVGVQLFVIRKGGKQVYSADGTPQFYPNNAPVREATRFIDYLKPRADEGVQRARLSELWNGDAAKGIKKSHGLALEAQVDSVIQMLPTFGSRAEAGAEKRPRQSQPASEYDFKQIARLGDSAEKVADKIDGRGDDSDLWLEKLEVEIARRRASRLKTRSARRDNSSLTLVQRIDTYTNATTNTCDSEAGETETETVPEVETALLMEVPPDVENGLCNSEVTQGFIGVCENSATEAEPDMLEWALFWASQGVPVFPLHEVYDDVCTCVCSDHWRKDNSGGWVKKCVDDVHVCGSECTSKGKHPRTDRALGMQNGLKVATTDPQKINAWWGKYRTANIGGRMLGKIGVDVDPKNGGNASLHDLCEKYGQEWLDTWGNESGSGGPHFVFDNPTGVTVRNSASKLAPGIDTRGDDGYLVMPASLHASGQRYKVKNPNPFLPVPQFIIDLLIAPKSEGEIVFQDRPVRVGAFSSQENFTSGNRNDGLFSLLWGYWGHAGVKDFGELCSLAHRLNVEKCVPPLESSEVEIILDSYRSTYLHRYGSLKSESKVA
jgi:hypothetical protein